MVFLPAVRAAQNGSENTETQLTPAAMSATDAGPGPSSVASSSRFAKPVGSMPPPHGPVIRKQNIACDACRTRKIRCQRTTIEQICEQCVAKGSECTSNYVEQLANSKNQKNGARKRRRKSETEDEGPVRERASLANIVNHDGGLMTGHSSSTSISAVSMALADPTPAPSRSSSSTPSLTRTPSIPAGIRTASQSQHDLLRYMFASEAVTHSLWDYNDLSSIRQCDLGESDLWEEMGGQVWKEAPSTVHASLEDDALHELADDLLDSFFSIAHIRYPLLEVEQFRARFSDPDFHPEGPLNHPLLAVALAWGGRFSESPTLAADREEVSARDGPSASKGFTRTRMVQLLVIRAREVAEVCKAFRHPKIENVQLGILMEPLLAQAPFLKSKYEPTCIIFAARHFTALGLNSPSGQLAISDGKKRAEAVFTWWILCLQDGFRSAFNRLCPALYDGYFDIDLQQQFQSSWDIGAGSALFGHRAVASGRDGNSRAGGTDHETLGWFAATNAGSALSRQLCNYLWTPRVRENGIPVQTLLDFANDNSRWRDAHLSKLGVPSKWPEDWDFLAAITACSTDVYYHCLWLIVLRAIRDFGILDDGSGGSPETLEILDRYRKEADHGAMRIAALAAVLTENGYLKLDPFIIYHPIYEAGLYLAAQAKEECLICVAGLKQYSIPFPSIWSLAEEIEVLYTSTKANLVVPAGDMVARQLPEKFIVDNFTPIPTASPHPQLNGEANGHWIPSGLDQSTQESQLPLQVPLAPTTNLNGSNRDVWSDGTPAPSRDVAWTLFDWLHQS